MTGISFRIDRDIARQSALSARIARAQADIASTKRLQRASDDPAAAVRLGQLRQSQTSETTWRANIEGGAALAARADGQLASAATLLDRARELSVTAANGATSAADRVTIAMELNSIADEVATLAAARDASGQLVFPEAPLRIPVGTGLTVTATTSRAAAFEIGGRSFETLLRDSANAITSGTPAAAIADIAAASAQLSNVRGDQGSRAARLDALRDRLIDSATVTAEEKSALEDTDIAAIYARMQADLLSLEAAQTSFARINRRTLFDLLA